MKVIIKAISNRKVVLILFVMFAVFASMQSYVQKERTYGDSETKYTNYNNYVVFEQSFIHLTEHKDLYQPYPREQWDLYKYSPTFSLFFGIFAIFPDAVGLNLWNLLNAIVLLLAVYYLPKFDNLQKGLMLIICLIELMTSMQNEQSNALIAGLIILSFGLLEKQNYVLATFCVIFSIYIKIFGVVGFAFFLFYPHKWKLVLYSIGWLLVLLVLPLLLVGYDQLKFLYTSWGQLLSSDHSASYGYSVMGWMHSWFGFETNKLMVVISGATIFLIPFLRIDMYKKYLFRFLALASVLLWMVIFNHKAESPTFIIAMAGVSLWFITSEKSTLNIFLFVSAFVFTSLSPTDIFPRFLRDQFVTPLMLKVFPCIMIWMKIIYDMSILKYKELAY